MCALPTNAPKFTIDTSAGTITIEGDLTWSPIASTGLNTVEGTFSIVMPLAGSIFDPDFEVPSFGASDVVNVANTSVLIDDPRYGDEDGKSSVQYSYQHVSYTSGSDSYGLVFSPFSESYTEGTVEGDQFYSIFIETNADFTKIKSILVQAYYLESESGSSDYVEEYYSGVDQFNNAIKVSEILAAEKVATNGADVLDFSDSTTPVKVDGLAGKDLIIGGSAADTLKGGLGWDTLRGGEDRDKLIGDVGRDVLYGGNDRDVLRGSTGDDTLIGNDGNDRLYGGKGADRLIGGIGNDLLSGGNANDFLRGGKGWDKLNDGGGTDTLWGDTGRDTFKFVYDDRQDIIEDFEDGWDTIDLSLWGDDLQRSDLTFDNTAEGVVISYETESLLVKGAAGTLVAADLGADDFFFG